jgi:UDP-N-acetylmuramoyl-tripeptide--D-alanyl-D-alanine ligase
MFLGRKLTIGINHSAEVRARKIRLTGSEGLTFDLQIGEKTFPTYLPMIGEHNVMNALAAAAAVEALGENPEITPEGLKNFTNLSLRQEVVKVGDNITLINDAYNANPVSMQLAINTFLKLKGSARGIVVLGDMLELGVESITLHRQLGEQVAQSDIRYLLLMGEYASKVREGAIAGGLPPEHIFIGKEHKDLNYFLDGLLSQGDWILVKGSRKMEMEKVIKSIEHRA